MLTNIFVVNFDALAQAIDALVQTIDFYLLNAGFEPDMYD